MQHNISEGTMRNLLISLSYDGSKYHGWQIQENAVTVQEVFQNAVKKVIGFSPDIKACSRTDTGVHANMFCLSMQVEHSIPCNQLVRALNRFLPLDVCATNCIEVSLDFHARYHSKGKQYIYKIWNHPVRSPFLDDSVYHYWYPIDVSDLDKAAKAYIGRHDFTAFCTVKGNQQMDMVRTIFRADVLRENNMVLFIVEGNGFLYNMVRIMAGTLLRVAQGKILPEQISDIINSKNRANAGPTAPACGLHLNRVFYDDEINKKLVNSNSSLFCM